MTKEELITIAYKFEFSNQIDMNDAYKLFTDFCEDKDKEKYNQIKDYMINIIQHPQFIINASTYINYAINYFENKFNVSRVYDKNGKLVSIF